MRGEYEERSSIHAYAASPDLHRIFGSQKSAVSRIKYPRVEQCALNQQRTPTKYFCRD